MMNKQLLFEFNSNKSYLSQDYIVSGCNKDAYNMIKSWPLWGKQAYANIFYIYGSKSCGKTHLCSIWGEKSHSHLLSLEHDIMEQLANHENFVIEDIEQYLIDEEKILHIFNLIIEMKKYLLITSNQHPSKLNISLADLRSRFNAINAIIIENPDDELLKIMISKLFAERQLRISQDIVKYIINHSNRSLEHICHIIQKLDDISLSSRKHITVKMIKDLLL